jgi:hypothetical protein
MQIMLRNYSVVSTAAGSRTTRAVRPVPPVARVSDRPPAPDYGAQCAACRSRSENSAGWCFQHAKAPEGLCYDQVAK